MIGTFRLYYLPTGSGAVRWGLHHEESGSRITAESITILKPCATEGPAKVAGIPSYVMRIEGAQMVYQDLEKRRVALVQAPR